MPYFYFDSYYFILVIPALIFTFYAQAKLNSTFNRYNKTLSATGKTAAQICREILDKNGLQHIAIGHVAGRMTDHFDPKNNIINLSDTTYNNTSIAAIGVAAHEAGHACQYKDEYFPIQIRTAIIPITRFACTFAPYLLLIGAFFSFGILIDIGIILFGASVLFQLITLPVEYNASKRALESIYQMGIMDSGELQATKKVLNSAALTYVAGLAAALASFLRILLLFGGRRRRD